MTSHPFRALSLLTLCAIAYNGSQAADFVAPDTLAEQGKPTIISYTQQFDIDSDLVVTTPHLRDFAAEVDSIMKTDTITHMSVTGVASIDGPESLNARLARARAKAMAEYLEKNTSIPEGITSISSKGEDWVMFRQLVEADPEIPARHRVLQIIDSKMSLTAKEGGIKALDGGKTWQYLVKNILPKMRCAEVELTVKHRYILPEPPVEEVVEVVEVVEPEPVVEEEVVEVVEEVPVALQEAWRRRFYIKTDLPYWVMLWTNVAFEVDLAKHWSFNLPVYFSAFNYFKHTLKFRVFGFQPGIRYWLKPQPKGVYFEAHYGMAWYDFAFDGKYRYQDHARKTPAIGGGIGAGYRLPISSNGHWHMEFGGGVGVYRLHYDRFLNTYGGKLVDSKKKTYFGLDNVNVSISYSFPIEKKKYEKEGGDL